jgi:hypothetical protein
MNTTQIHDMYILHQIMSEKIRHTNRFVSNLQRLKMTRELRFALFKRVNNSTGQVKKSVLNTISINALETI